MAMIEHGPSALHRWSDGGQAERAAERRDSYRVAVRDKARLRASSNELPLEDLSASGMSLIVATDRVCNIAAGVARLQLGSDLGFDARFDLVSARANGGVVLLGTRFRTLEPESLRALSQFLTREYMNQTRQTRQALATGASTLVSDDPTYVRKLLRFHCLSRRQPLTAYQGEQRLPVRLRVEEITSHTVRIRSTIPLPAHLPTGVPLLFLLSATGSALFFESSVWGVRQHSAELTLPTRLVRSGFRDSFRTTVHNKDLVLSFRHPRLKHTVHKRALDVSARGLSFPLDPSQDVLFPGDHLSSLEISLPTGTTRASAIIRSIKGPSEGALSCGVELIELDDARLWGLTVFDQAHPNSQLNRDAHGRAWKALDTSGYVELWTPPETRPSARAKFHDSWQTMPESDGQILVINNRRGRAVGTFAANRIYSRTWMMHQLGIDERARKVTDRRPFYAITRELYRGLLYMLQHLTDLEFLVVYFAAESRWNERIHLEFQQHYPGHADAVACSRYGVYRALTSIPALPDGTERMRPLHEDERPLLARALGRQCAPLELEAFDYRQGTLDMGAFTQRCRSAGYERERQLLALVDEHDWPVGVLIAELGNEGVNLFNLLNTCRYVPLRHTEARNVSTLRLALKAARRLYGARGKQSFLFLDYGECNSVDYEGVGYTYLCDGLSWLVRRDALSTWLTYVDDMLGMKAEPPIASGER